jgi:hypothetical protein
MGIRYGQEVIQEEVMAIKHTFKREISVVLFACLMAFFVWGVFEPEAMRAAEFLTLPIFGYGATAFITGTVQQIRADERY